MKQNIFKRSCLLLSVLLIPAGGFAFAQSDQQETLAITTYYHSPYGVYESLKLNPTNSIPSDSAFSPGVMYFDNRPGYKMIRYYDDSGWVNLTEPVPPPPSYWNEGGGNIYNSTANSVLIGTSSPSAGNKLSVRGNIKASGDVCDGTKCLKDCLFP